MGNSVFMQRLLPSMLTLVCLLNSVHASIGVAQGISLGATRVVFDASKETTSLSVNNSTNDRVWLMRLWVSPYDDILSSKNNGVRVKESPPFIITPPLYRLDAKSSMQLRINKIEDNLPLDRESVYYINALAIPPGKDSLGKESSAVNGLQFAINTRIKLFYRPQKLKSDVEVKALPGRIMLKKTGNELILSNPTPYYITVVRMVINGKSVSTEQDTMIAPFSRLILPCACMEHGTFRYQTIDDSGAQTLPIDKPF